MIAKETLDFLKKLEKNNERGWFQANKERFISAQDNVLAIAGDDRTISKFDRSDRDRPEGLYF